MDLKVKGRKALVTGSTAGIGFAVACGLAAEGAAVIVNGRGAEGVERAVARIREAVPDAAVEGIAADATTAEGAQAIAGRAPEIDILVNNLGIFDPKGFFDIPDEEWRRFFDANVLSGVRLSRIYGRGMAGRGWGRIVFVSSESALNIPVEMIHYGMTKAAQLAVARGLAIELAGTGVTVNSVLPGPTRTEGVMTFLERLAQEGNKSVADIEADFFRTARPTSLIRRFADPAEIAALVVYLCGDIASATTGAALRVEGGLINSMV